MEEQCPAEGAVLVSGVQDWFSSHLKSILDRRSQRTWPHWSNGNERGQHLTITRELVVDHRNQYVNFKIIELKIKYKKATILISFNSCYLIEFYIRALWMRSYLGNTDKLLIFHSCLQSRIDWMSFISYMLPIHRFWVFFLWLILCLFHLNVEIGKSLVTWLHIYHFTLGSYLVWAIIDHYTNSQKVLQSAKKIFFPSRNKELGKTKGQQMETLKCLRKRQAGFHPVDCDEWATSVPARILDLIEKCRWYGYKQLRWNTREEKGITFKKQTLWCHCYIYK